MSVPLLLVEDLLQYRTRAFVIDIRPVEPYGKSHFIKAINVPNPNEADFTEIFPPELLNPEDLLKELTSQDPAKPTGLQGSPPWLYADEVHVLLVVVIGDRNDVGMSFAMSCLKAGISYVCCLAGGHDAVLADAPTFTESGFKSIS